MFLRKNWLPLSVFVVAIAVVCVYMIQTQSPKAPIKIYKPVDPIEQPTAEKPPVETEVPVGDTSQGGHFHADGTWHVEPHAETPKTQVSQPETPAYIHDPDATERPDGWDPELVFDGGHSKKIDLNYRPLTEEEQAEYERLKATENPEHYRNFEAGIRIVAISNIKQKHRPEVTARIWADQEAGRITKNEALKQIREFNGIFAD